MAWFLFGISMGVVLTGWLAWVDLTGVSFWTSPNKALANQIRHDSLVAALVIGAVAPLVCRARFWRRVALSAMATATTIIAYYCCGIAWLFLFGV
jgi:hypothetical protein